MLPGVSRKIAIPFVLLAIAGWLLYVAGFIVRNFAYKDSSSQPESAAHPDYFFLWLFIFAPPLVMLFSLMYIFWHHSIARFLMYLFLPLYLVGAGGVLLFDGLQIYEHYEDLTFVQCRETQIGRVDIHGSERYVPVEFAGVVTCIICHYVFLLLSPCFASGKREYS